MTPNTAIDADCDRAMQLQLAGRADLAERLYREILLGQPEHAAANYCLGMLQVQRKHPAQGLSYLLTALQADPQTVDYWLGYLEALLLAGQAADAGQTLALGREHGLCGAAVEDFARRLDAATASSPAATAATAAAPGESAAAGSDEPAAASRTTRRRDDREAVKGERALLAALKRGDNAAAFKQARSLTERFAGRGLGWKVQGALLWADGAHDAALEAMQTAARLLPDDAETHSNLGLTLTKLNRFEEAEAALQRALAIDPLFAAAHYRLGFAYAHQERYDEAEISHRTALALNSDYVQGDNELGRSNLLFMLSHSAATTPAALFAEHCRFSEQFETPLRAAWPTHSNDRDPQRSLRVGIVSGDLRQHAVATFAEPLLRELGRHSSLELSAYFTHPTEDEVSLRMKGCFKHWHAVSTLSDKDLARKIGNEAIDILIDLSGHTYMNRLLTFARKPAPVQVSWLGYPGTTGLRAMDYYLADPHFLPPGQFDAYFTEKLVYLPAAWVFEPHAAALPVNPLPALATGSLCFGSFNRLGKLNAATIRLWSELLRVLPRSRMLIAAIPRELDRTRLLNLFAAQGIAPARLTFHARCGLDAYLALHHQVDLCLDTYPYTGGTTTNHALWMGVPTLTLAGSTPASRQGAANLGHVGLEGFVAASPAEFLERGRYWADHLPELAEVRDGLRARWLRSTTRHPATIAAAIHAALRHLWTRWCAGLPPESFTAAAGASLEGHDH